MLGKRGKRDSYKNEHGTKRHGNIHEAENTMSENENSQMDVE